MSATGNIQMRFKRLVKKMILPVLLSRFPLEKKYNPYVDICSKVTTESPIIVEGGANKGDIIARFLIDYPTPIIHAFEPIPELAKALIDRFKEYSSVIIHEQALGAQNQITTFNVNNFDATSSILPSTSESLRYHGHMVERNHEINVQMVRLDEEIDQEIDIMKLDLQGYELEALKGCGELIYKIKTIIIEIEFVPLYEQQPLFGDIDLFLREKGFNLLNLYDLSTPDPQERQLVAGDAIYLNSHYFPE
jgi:FkbM family methyltransferase